MNEWLIDYHIIIMIIDYMMTVHAHNTPPKEILLYFKYLLVRSEENKKQQQPFIQISIIHVPKLFSGVVRTTTGRRRVPVHVYKLFCIFFLNRIWKLYGCCMLCCIITGGMISLVLLFLLMHGSTVVPGMNTTAPLLLLV